jgi:DNA topoisomerase-3
LFKRQFLTRENKSIYATNNGKALINSLPEIATTPDMTVLWEAKLNDIAHKQLNYNAFMEPLVENLEALMDQARPTSLSRFSSLENTRKTASFKKRRSTKKRKI